MFASERNDTNRMISTTIRPMIHQRARCLRRGEGSAGRSLGMRTEREPNVRFCSPNGTTGRAGEPNCPIAAEEVGSGSSCGVSAGSCSQSGKQEEHFYVSRSELVQMVEDALKARGLA